MNSLYLNINWDLIINIAIPSLLIIIGWFVVYLLNQRNEIKKEARGYRIEMLRSFMDLVRFIEEKNSLTGLCAPNQHGHCQPNNIPPMSDWAAVLILIKMYGNADEIRQYERIIAKIQEILCDCDCNNETCSDTQFNGLMVKIKKLEKICVNSLRKELKFKKTEIGSLTN